MSLKLYDINWVNFKSNSNKKMLNFMVSMFQKSIEFKAFKLYKVNVELFVVVRTFDEVNRQFMSRSSLTDSQCIVHNLQLDAEAEPEICLDFSKS
jgi:hypothetical protein